MKNITKHICAVGGPIFAAAALLLSFGLMGSGCGGDKNGSQTIPDTTAPMVAFVNPADLATDVPTNRKVAATFSEAMDPPTITKATFIIKQGTTPVKGTVAYVGTIATFKPESNFASGTLYTVTITIGAKDLADNALANDYSWSFTTGEIPDTTPPEVSSTTPLNGAAEVALNAPITATFSEEMNPLTISTTTFSLFNGATPVPGAVTYVGVTALFIPTIPPAPNTIYTATITAGAKDLADNALANDYSWSFTTGEIPDTTPPEVSSTTPLNGAAEVALNAPITATFSEEMNPLTISTTTFSLL
ncbi:MAG: Ig-like domain-containing protein, partial [bacterium]|nr:Ig-like domain-containing protein [bacterium]